MQGVQGTLKRSVWNRFVKEGALDESRIEKRISESWHLCRQEGVNPYYGKGKTILTKDKIQERKKKNRKLIDAALPFLKNLLPVFEHTKSLFLLVDPQGYVLHMDGHKMALERAKSIHFIEGVKWTEEEVGTNAIGTSLRIKEPIHIAGAEHYAVASHSWGCSSSPIWNENGQLAGIFNVSYPIDYGKNEHMLPSVIASAYAIEQRLIAEAKNRELELLQHASLIRPADSLMMICNDEGRIVWLTEKMRKLLPRWHQLTLSDVKNEGFSIFQKEPLHSPLKKDELIGYRIYINNATKHTPKACSPFRFGGVKGASKAFQNTLNQAEKASRTNVTVHLCGETGTGKEVLARAIHLNSSRKNGPFVAVNCGAIPKDLLASELFGYARGAFTGAKQNGHKGKFEQAHKGTIFLDEIGEIPQEMQVALLRVVEEKKIVPLGSMQPVPVDIRIITASHRNLKELVDRGVFREDLYYRIFVYPIELPPLRKRTEDIPYFIKDFCEKNQWNVHFPEEADEFLQSLPWPGNIRQLLHFLERFKIETGDGHPTLEQMKSMLNPVQTPEQPEKLPSKERLTYREQIEKSRMMEALLATDGNVTKAAKKINMPRSTFYRKLKKYHL